MSTAALARAGSGQPVRRARCVAGRPLVGSGTPVPRLMGPSPRLAGTHRFEVEPPRGGVVLTHALEAGTERLMTRLWPLYVRPLHDAITEDALDRAEPATSGRVARAAHPSAWVRALRALSDAGREASP